MNLALTGFEQTAAVSIASGLVCLLVATLWTWIVAWRVSWKWGLGLTLFFPAAAVFIPKHLSRLRIPVALLVLSALLIGVPFALNAVINKIDLGPRERIVDGQRHITLTGWDQHEYSILSQRPDVVVLQMANADVTDETMSRLRTLTQLEELDLNDTQITDAALVTLAELPKLARLRLRGTKITDDGFRRHLAGRDSLVELDVRDTAVASKTLREWKKANENRKYLK